MEKKRKQASFLAAGWGGFLIVHSLNICTTICFKLIDMLVKNNHYGRMASRTHLGGNRNPHEPARREFAHFLILALRDLRNEISQNNRECAHIRMYVYRLTNV